MIQHRAEGGFTNEVSRLIREVDIVDLGEDEVRDGGEEGAGPAEGGDDGGPLDVGHGEDVERGADGQVALQRERQDRQHRGVRGAAIQTVSNLMIHQKSKYLPFREKGSHLAKVFSEWIRVLVPVDGEFVWNTCSGRID